MTSSTPSSSRCASLCRVACLSILSLLIVHTSVDAQIHQLQSVPVPKKYYNILDFFFVFGSRDNPPSFFPLPDGKPTIKFVNFKLSNSSEDNKSVQLSLISYKQWQKHFGPLGGPKDFCCGAESKEVKNPMCPAPYRFIMPSKEQIIYDVRPGIVEASIANQRYELKHTDAYVLLISNCGTEKEGLINGEVVVKNAYGYLPGQEFPKLILYFWMILAYLIVLTIWSVLLIIHWEQGIHFHYCIEGIIFLGLIECIVQFAYLWSWNAYGSRNSALLVMSILTTVVKNIFSYMLVLVASLGWGITKPNLERSVVFKIQSIVLLYIILESVRQVKEELINLPNLPITQFLLVVLCLVPISILNGIIFYWIFSSLTDLLEVLEEQKQFEKLQTFRRLLAVLVASLLLYTIALFVQIYAAASDFRTRWQVQWWVDDGAPHMLFILVLLVMMCLWKPNEHSRRLAYFEELPDEDELENIPSKSGKNIRVWGVELDLDDETSGDDSDINHNGQVFDIPTHHSYPVNVSNNKEAI